MGHDVLVVVGDVLGVVERLVEFSKVLLFYVLCTIKIEQIQYVPIFRRINKKNFI